MWQARYLTIHLSSLPPPSPLPRRFRLVLLCVFSGVVKVASMRQPTKTSSTSSIWLYSSAVKQLNPIYGRPHCDARWNVTKIIYSFTKSRPRILSILHHLSPDFGVILFLPGSRARRKVNLTLRIEMKYEVTISRQVQSSWEVFILRANW